MRATLFAPLPNPPGSRGSWLRREAAVHAREVHPTAVERAAARPSSVDAEAQKRLADARAPTATAASTEQRRLA
jgi:hypothetical protein